MPDPTLQSVVDQVATLLKKHDIGAFVLLASKTHTHYLHQLDPSWSCIHYEGDFLRVRSKRQDYASVEIQKEALRLTVGMLAGFVDAARMETEKLEKLLLKISETGVQIAHVSKLDKPPETAAGMTDAQKAEAFDVLIYHLEAIMPREVTLKQFQGLSLADALSQFVFVLKADWERLNK